MIVVLQHGNEGFFSVQRTPGDHDYMQAAIDTASAGIAAGQSPFGAVIVRAGDVLAAAHNTVWSTCDPTAHAEINAIREAARALSSFDLSGCTMYTTCEPCPMCLAAIHWSRIDRVVFGATIADATAAGFREFPVDARVLAELGQIPLRVDNGPLRAECAGLFARWREAGLSEPY